MISYMTSLRWTILFCVDVKQRKMQSREKRNVQMKDMPATNLRYVEKAQRRMHDTKKCFPNKTR